VVVEQFTGKATMIDSESKAEDSKVVEIYGPWLRNKGSDLMLRAAFGRLSPAYTLAVESTLGMPSLPESYHGLYRVGRHRNSRELAAEFSAGAFKRGLRALGKEALLSLSSPVMLRRQGLVAGEKVTALLDCSGHAYGEGWPVRRLRERAEYFRVLKRRGVRMVMLPQTFGPFGGGELREWAREALGHFELIFARDEVSAVYLLELGLDPEIIYTVPDISHGVDGQGARDAEEWAGRVCIVPSARMIDKTSRAISARYLGFLVCCIRAVSRAGFEPCIMVHEANDLALAREARISAGIHVRIYDESAVVLKGMMGACRGVISSRYHPLVGALSQGTPALGTSWSHKYGSLFDEYEVPEWVVGPAMADGELSARISGWLAADSQRAARRRLAQIGPEQRRKVEVMWRRVEAHLSGRAEVGGGQLGGCAMGWS
jgi:polysaccharide pyruvyl transferase WcaK-like protein